ncbi:MAG: HD-GYP domain-containing protein, partial [Vulcanimicrobiota bacterium]
AAIASEGLHVDSQEKLVFDVSNPLIQYLLTHPEVVVIDKSRREFKYFELKEVFNEALMMPLKVGGKVQGILWVARRPKSHKFSDGAKTVMNYMGNALGYMTENLDLITEVQERAFNIVKGLAKALEQKDEYTRGHSNHVSQYSVMFAHHLGLDRNSIETIERAALLHDIGKIGIPDNVLNKPGKLTDEEFEIIKSHPLYGAELLKILGFLKNEQVLILHHHEKFDGTGYPYGLTADKIPRGSAIISLADVFDALTTDRPYRKAFSVEKAIEIMQEMKGKNFEPSLCDEFIKFVNMRLNKNRK